VETSERPHGAEGSTTTGVRIIKRYANRKLYDTRDSRYVTLQEIAEFVRGTDDVQVIDNRTKEDLTNVTLAQIIYEEEKKGGESRSIPNLRDFIQQGKSRMREGRERLMESLQRGPVGKLVTRHDAEEGDEELSDAESAPVDKEPAAASEHREAWSAIPRLADEGLRNLLQTAVTHVQQLQAEVGRLGGRIEELEQRLGRNSSDKVTSEETSEETSDADES